MVPHPGPRATEQRARGKSGALRAAIFGVNDGLVSNLSLIMGVTGAGVSNRVILLTGVAGLLAGAFSMGAGEYISMRVQRELFERLIHTEAHELWRSPAEELEELAGIYRERGVPPDVADEVAAALMRDPDTALAAHAREELGLDPEEGLGSPWGAAGSSFVAFTLGALVPLVPFMFGTGVGAAMASVVASGLTLFAVGGAVSAFTGRPVLLSGSRMLLFGAAAASITYGVGRLLHVGTGI
ncbi:MAG: VIT1/CCC1 transporter family protein [Actinobacteria bacterium]|nr:VIT1/CCC1 transporter family protein [Actinomycetota bacterium]